MRHDIGNTTATNLEGFMYGPQRTKQDMAEQFGLKGKALTDILRREVTAGRLVRRMVFRDPAMGGGKHCVYQSIPQNLELDLSDNEGN